MDFNTYDKYTDFCLDKGYRSASFSGTAAVLCKPKVRALEFVRLNECFDQAMRADTNLFNQ